MQNGYIYYMLRSLCQQQALASIYCEPQDPEAFVFARIEHVTARHMLVATITPWGKLDGWWVRRTADVFQVLHGEDYEKRLAFLLEYHQQQYVPLLENASTEEADLMQAVLALAVSRGQIVTIMTEQDSFPAIPSQIDDLRVTFQVLDLFGAPLEEGSLPLRDIDALSIGTEEERMYDILRAHFLSPEGWVN